MARTGGIHFDRHHREEQAAEPRLLTHHAVVSPLVQEEDDDSEELDLDNLKKKLLGMAMVPDVDQGFSYSKNLCW